MYRNSSMHNDSPPGIKHKYIKTSNGRHNNKCLYEKKQPNHSTENLQKQSYDKDLSVTTEHNNYARMKIDSPEFVPFSSRSSTLLPSISSSDGILINNVTPDENSIFNRSSSDGELFKKNSTFEHKHIIDMDFSSEAARLWNKVGHTMDKICPQGYLGDLDTKILCGMMIEIRLCEIYENKLHNIHEKTSRDKIMVCDGKVYVGRTYDEKVLHLI